MMIEPEPQLVLIEEPLPVPAEPEVEELFTTLHPFPTRSWVNSTPSAGPSSLSELLAQAPAEGTLDPITVPVLDNLQLFPEVVIGDEEPPKQQEHVLSVTVDTVSPSLPPIMIPFCSSPQPHLPRSQVCELQRFQTSMNHYLSDHEL